MMQLINAYLMFIKINQFHIYISIKMYKDSKLMQFEQNQVN